MTTNVLFLCPHSAGKSLLAATYTRAAAARSGVDLSVQIAGTDPDEHPMPTVVDALERQGFEIGWNPKLVSADDTQWADIIVSVGCDHGDIPTDQPIADWSVPMLSEDFNASVSAIHALAEDFVAKM